MKLLVIASRFPSPIDKGDKLRLYYQLQSLSDHFDITLCAISDEKVGPEDLNVINKFCSQVYIFQIHWWSQLWYLIVNVFTSKPWQVTYFYRRRIKKKIDSIFLEVQPDRVYCQLIRTALYGLNLPTYKTLDYMDTFSEIAQKRRELHSGALKVFFNWEYSRVRDFEKKVFPYFNQITTISEREKSILPVSHKEEVVVIPNGVDASFFKRLNYPGGDATYDIVFVGRLDYFPNQEAARYIANDILPMTKPDGKAVTCYVGGANPGPGVKKLRRDYIEIGGTVEDIREYYCKGKILVAPLFQGGGLQNKVLEAMALGIPVLTTSHVNASIGAQNGRSIMIADSPDKFCTEILRLLTDSELYIKISDNARQLVLDQFRWEVVNTHLTELLKSQSPRRYLLK